MVKIIITVSTKILWLFILCFCFTSLHAQECGCNVQQVLDNEVESCNMVIGETIAVGTVEELWAAFLEANEVGGNRTILIEDGNYEIASASNYPYLTGSNMVIRSLSGNRDAVILTGQGMQSVAPGTETCLSLQGTNVTVADLTISSVGNHAISMIDDGHLFHNIKFQDTFEQMVKGNSVGDGPDDCVLQCCYFEYTEGVGPQWYIGGIDIHGGNNWLVRDNVFFGIASPSQQIAEHAIHFWDDSGDNVVERNIIVNCDRGIGFGLGDSPNQAGVIRNNFIFNDGLGLFSDVGISLESSPNTLVYHNSIHIEFMNAIEYRFAETYDVSIVNNLCNRAITSRNGGEASVSNNIEVAQENWYLDPANGDLRLAFLVEEVVDAGEQLESVSEDIDQKPRQGNPDIGAHEFPLMSFILSAESSFSFGPNPFSDFININGLGLTERCLLLDQKGNLAAEKSQSGIWHLDHLPNGLYFLHLVGPKKNRVFSLNLHSD